MSGASSHPGTMKSSERIEELSEDIDVAIREFLERHPRTSSRQIRAAARVAGGHVRGPDRLVERVLTGVIAFLLGIAVGAMVL